ncbi:MAG: fumarate hydratase [archaeon]|jgi:tartrate/fumarate subfamily iron-sulfur-dependent hydro-lyase alpha chain|nr:fumarate hydratase [archaeon]
MNEGDLKNKIVSLYEKTATELPNDIVFALEKAKEKEQDIIGKEIIAKILENVNQAKTDCLPICQDTGIPIFYIKRTKDYSEEDLRKIIDEATVIATEKIPLRPNAVDVLTDKNLGNKPIIHFEESEEFKIDLLLKGGGSENVSTIYQLPNQKINANRDLDGVRKSILDAVFNAQGKGCPPYIIGVAVGGNIEEVAHLSKKQLLRKITDLNPNNKLGEFEKEVLNEINQLNIGPQGLDGKTTTLGVKTIFTARHPASFFVGVSIGCWCLRRQSL